MNTSGLKVVEYTYDAWGNPLTVKGSMASTLGQYNPLRYRGYVYDTETGLYYLQSRYYNPEIGRFISADAYTSTGQGLVSNNMFTYCLNNPVNMEDTQGNWPKWVKGLYNIVVGAGEVALGAGIGACAGWTGIGGAAAAILIADGTGKATQGVGQVVNDVFDTNVMSEENLVKSSVVEAGQVIGGETGGRVAVVLYDSAVALSSVYAMSHPCFVAGTMIQTEAGVTPIEAIAVGDKVWAWDEETGEVALKKVVETYVNKTDKLIHVFVNSEEIITTPMHPFYSPVKGWTDAVQLRAGDILVLVNGEYVVVEKVQHEILEAPVTVYNFQVDEYHTYYVSNSGVLVHNKCSGSYDIKFASGKHYVGKGSESRMNVSAKFRSRLNNDPAISMEWKYAPDEQTAYVDEYFRMAQYGVNNANTYNKIWSPGRKIFISQWEK